MLKKLCQRAAVAASLCAAMVGSAHAVTWSLSGVTFEDGAIATGWFDFDGVTGVGNYNLTTTAGPVFSAFTYVPGNSYTWSALPSNNFAWVSLDGQRFLALTLAGPLAGATGNVAIQGGGYSSNGSWEHLDGLTNRDVGYSGAHLVLAVSAVPEVDTFAMLIAGLGLIGAMARRRSARAG